MLQDKAKTFSISIDGLAASGKSTIAEALAKELGVIYINTGLMYRAIGLYMLRENVVDDPDAIAERMENVDIAVRFSGGEQRMYLFDDDVTDAIRALRVSIATSKVSRVPQVREKMVALQRRIAEGQSVVMDGRDIGTKVLPDATLKIYLTASAEVRARRRCEQLEAAFELPINFDQVLEEIVRRDDLDTHRAVSPLQPAEGSVLIDNTTMSLDETYALIKKLALEAINGGADS